MIFTTRAPVVDVEGFSGPFDLLLRLIERGQLDVLTISLAAVTDKYLALLTDLELRDPEHLSAFLVVAAKLILIKSTLLLPTRPKGAALPEPDDPTDLTARLREYQRYRGAADALSERLDSGLRSYPHLPPPYRPGPRPSPERLDPRSLRAAYRRALARKRDEPEERPLKEAPYSVADAVSAIHQVLGGREVVRFADLLSPQDARSRFIATFLAVLEVARLGSATIVQEEKFGDIVLRRNPTLGSMNPVHPEPE